MEQVLSDDPSNDRIIGHAFILLVNDGRMAQAEKLAARATDKSHWAPLAELVLALKAAKAGDFAGADKRLSGLALRGPYEVMVPLLRAWAEVGMKQPDQALKSLGAIEAMAGFANFYNLHSALILDLAGRTKEAAQRFDKATEGSRIRRCCGWCRPRAPFSSAPARPTKRARCTRIFSSRRPNR